MKNQPAFKATRIQTIFNVTLIVAVAFLFFYSFYFKNEKIAYVESAKIMNEYKGAIRAKKEYDMKVTSWNSKIDTLESELHKSFKQYESDLSSMSSKEKTTAKQLLEMKQNRLNDYRRAIQENAREEESKFYKQIVVEVNAFLLKYGEKHNYKLILIASQSGTIAYAREGMDITPDVLQELNEG